MKEEEDTATVAAIESTQIDLLGMMQRLVERVEQLKTRSQRTDDFHSRPLPRGSRANQIRQVICYCCGQAGHFARGCAQARSRSDAPVPLGATTVRNIEQNAPHTSSSPQHNVPQTFTINNVLSYLLSCNIYDMPVSFLVDTGAGVSLLNKEVWDKLRRPEDTLNPVVDERIMGVDGIPIRVEGSVSVPVTIGKSMFNQQRQITAVAILKLDFLEAKKCVLDLAGGKIQLTDQNVTLIAKPIQSGTQSAKVTVFKKTTIPPRSEMEIMAHIHSKEPGTWLLEGCQFKELPIFVARCISIPKDQTPSS